MPQHTSTDHVNNAIVSAVKQPADLSTSVDTSSSSIAVTAPPASTATTTSSDEPAERAAVVDMETSMTTTADVQVHEPQQRDGVPTRHVRLPKRADDFDEMLTSADESELDPLQWKDNKDMDGDAMSNSNALEFDDDGVEWSKDFDRDSQSPTSRKRPSHVRCVVVAIVVLLVVAAVCAAVLLLHRRMQVEPVYDFHFARYYGNHMVLQRAPSRAVIWGYGPVISDNTSVVVTVDNNSTARAVYHTTVKHTAAGRVWKVMLDAVSDSRAYTITAALVASPSQTIQLRDVLFGDVWLCVGQLRLRHSVAKILNMSSNDKQNDAFHEIRLFSLFPAKSDMLWYDLRGIQLPWSVPRSMISVPKDTSVASAAHFPSVCWLFAKRLHARLRRPIGLVSVTYSGSYVDEWIPSHVIDTCQVKYTDSSSRIWNGMIHPLLDLPIFGAIWHQGTQGLTAAQNYSCMMTGLVNYWRRTASDRTSNSTDFLFPIGIVQLLPDGGFDLIDRTKNYGYTDARWQQTANYGYLPNEAMRRTFLAVTIDLPDELHDESNNQSTHASVHSQQKREIASRLVLGALNIAYQQSDVSFQGPWPIGYISSPSSSTLRLNFDASDLYVHNQHGYIGFEICCTERITESCHPSISTDERQWLSAPVSAAQSSSPSAIQLSVASCDRGRHVVGLRYAWRQTPCAALQCAVYSSSNPRLPMSSYIRLGLVSDSQWHTLPSQPVQLVS